MSNSETPAQQIEQRDGSPVLRFSAILESNGMRGTGIVVPGAGGNRSMEQ